MTLINDANIRSAFHGTGTDVQRTHSPPIPVATAVASEYFAAPVRKTLVVNPNYDDEEDNGTVSNRRSRDTVGTRSQVKRRRQRELQEDDDSSDLSDESEEEHEPNPRAVQQIRFNKMPHRSRAGSSPLRNSNGRANDQRNAETNRTNQDGGIRRGSLGAAEVVKQRIRRDTTTSSDMSSENELDPSIFKRRPLKPSRGQGNVMFQQHAEEDDDQVEQERLEDVKEDEGEISDHVSETSSLSSGFNGTVDSESLLDADDNHTSSYALGDLAPPGLNLPSSSSPKKVRVQASTTLQALPPPRPISTVVPVSALGQAIRARQAKPTNPVENFAKFSGKGVLDPLNIKIYAPFSEASDKPFDMPIQKPIRDGESGAIPFVTVADTIGLSLWRYHEEDIRPVIPREKLDVNRWTLRIVDDGEVDFDFPPLNRASSITDFTSNNNRPARGRSRGKTFDEFALVEATDTQYSQNKQITPRYTEQYEEFSKTTDNADMIQVTTNSSLETENEVHGNVIPKPFAFAARKGSTSLDQPATPTSYSTPRTGPLKLLKIHFTSLEAQSQTSTIEVSTDTYIAEVLDVVCKRWKLDKSHHFLKVSGTNTVAPLDRQVEAIGGRSDLDLMRRRFAYDGGPGPGSSPSSSSPKAPLLLPDDLTIRKGKKATTGSHPLAQNLDLSAMPANFKKYTVMRKQPMSFAPSHPRTLLIDSDYLHICPGETGRTIFDTANAKTTTVPFDRIIGCKTSRRHPKTIQVILYRDRETKRYDFEAQTASEAAEIVAEIKAAMGPFRDNEIT